MATPVTMPMLGLTMEEGTVAEWLKQEGDTVTKDEPLLTVEMDKGTQEVPSPAAGVLRRIVVQAGTTVAVKTLIAEIGDPGEVLPPPGPATPPATAGASTAPPRTAGEPSSAASTPTPAAGGPGDVPARPPTDSQPATVSDPSAPPAAGGPGDLPARPPTESELATLSLASASGAGQARRLFASPRARMRARALRVELHGIRGSGPQGRIVESDVLAAGAAGTVGAGETAGDAETRVLATPLARRLALEYGVSIAELQGTGPGGRITQEDVLAAAASADKAPQASSPAAGEVPSRAAEGELRPLSRIRRLTAERMAASAQATASVTLFLEADLSEAGRFRAQLQPEFARLGVAKLPWDALIARAVALALVDHPAVLAQWADGQGLRQPPSVHVGVAVALEPEGLVVPVLKDAGTRSLRELAGDLLALVEKARAGRLSPADMHGGTFTVSNLGAYRIDGFTPILNPPETAILGVGRITDKPVVVDGKVEVRTLCTLSLTFDHRVVDGVPAAAFLARLAELLERPYTLLGI